MGLINKGPSILVANTDSEAISIINRLSGNNYSNITEALEWVLQQNNIFVQNNEINNIITDNLVIHLDANIVESYPKGGSIFYDLYRNDNVNLDSPTFNFDYFSFDGSGTYDGVTPGDRLTGFNTAYTDIKNGVDGVTYVLWFMITSEQPHGQRLLHGGSTKNHIEIKDENTSSPYFRTEAKFQNGYSFGTSTIPGGSLVGRWINIAIVFDTESSPRNVKWYHNGQLFYTDSNFDNGTEGVNESFSFTEFGRSGEILLILTLKVLKVN